LVEKDGDLLAEMEPQVRTGRSAVSGYKETYPNYAKRYGKSARTVKRWVAIGKEKTDHCPLDDPGEMRAWWSRCMTQKCPDGVLAVAVGEMKEEEKVPEISSVELETDERGLEGALSRLEQVEVTLAAKADQPGQATPWLNALSRMTSLKTNIRKELQASGELVPKKEVAAELLSFHGQIATILKSVLTDEQGREVFELLEREVFS
jgi:hypothetical protein